MVDLEELREESRNTKRNKRENAVLAICMATGKRTKFYNASEAERRLNVGKRSIQNACLRMVVSCGYFFMYVVRDKEPVKKTEKIKRVTYVKKNKKCLTCGKEFTSYNDDYCTTQCYGKALGVHIEARPLELSYVDNF